MIKNLLDLEYRVTGRVFDVYIKPFGNRIFSDGTILKKTKNADITRMDRLLSDQYTIPESYVGKHGALPVGHYTYNSDTRKIIAESEIPDDNFVHIPVIKDFQFKDEIYKLVKMNHINSILSAVGYTNAEEYKSLIKSLIFKVDGIPLFKIKIRDGRKHTMTIPHIKMMANLFFYGNPVYVCNPFDYKIDSIISVTNQIFNSKYNKDIDIDSKIYIYQHTQTADINSKISLIRNKKTVELLSSNPMSYYLYTAIMVMLLDRSCDYHIKDPKILCNLEIYRDMISSKPTMLSYEKFESCQA